MTRPPAIALHQVSKHFQKRTIRREYTTFKSELVRWIRREKQPQRLTHLTALKDVTLDVPVGKTMGIIGRNGAGKSTLLKLITGIYSPTSGRIDVRGRISALLELGAGFHPDFSGRENILINGIILGMTRAEAQAKTPEIIEFSELGDFIDEPVRTYSSGMYMRLAFSVATHVDPDILIVDEILAVGDAHFSHKSLAKMTEFKRTGKTILLVTHDLATVEEWCDLAAWLDGGSVRALGNPRDVVRQYQAEVARREGSSSAGPAPRLRDATVTSARRPTRGPQVPWEQRFGSFAAEIESVQLLSAGRTELGSLSPEDPLEVELRCAVLAPVSGLVLGITVRKEDGTELYGTSTRAHNLTLPGLSGATLIARLRMERLGLGPGTYRLDVTARDENAVDLDCHQGLYSFRVETDLRESGPLRPPHQWEVEVEGEAPAVAAAASSGAQPDRTL
jgi:lipopolysaccharide transport system ATP-binding protein